MFNLDERDMMAGKSFGEMLQHYMIRNNICLENLPKNLVIGFPPMTRNNNMMMMPQNGGVNLINQNRLNNNINNMNQIEMLNNMHMNHFQNKINNINYLNIKEINTKEKSLIYFFNFISFESKEKLNLKGSKLIINYYGLKKSMVYIDLNLKVEEIISRIYWQLFYPSFKREEHTRTASYQTTEFIFKNPVYIVDKENCPFQYPNFLNLEYNYRDIQMFANYTGKQIGLNDNSEIFLKIKPEFYNDIIKFPKIPVSTLFTTDNIIIEKIFALNLGYNPLEKIKKLFNNNNFRLNVNIGGFPANDVNYITENCELSLEKKEIGAGGQGLNFVGIETGKIINLDFNKNAPNLRIINKGLNIFGFCNNSICKAYMKEMVYKIVLSKDGLKFNLNERVADIRCPICNEIIKLKTCGFYDCEYQFIGKKIANGEIYQFDSKTRETKENNFEYYDVFKNGEIIWTEINVYILPKQSIKYMPNKI